MKNNPMHVRFLAAYLRADVAFDLALISFVAIGATGLTGAAAAVSCVAGGFTVVSCLRRRARLARAVLLLRDRTRTRCQFVDGVLK
jgi:hypothetical protein